MALITVTSGAYIKPLLLDLMKNHGDFVWPIFGDVIANSRGDIVDSVKQDGRSSDNHFGRPDKMIVAAQILAAKNS